MKVEINPDLRRNEFREIAKLHGSCIPWSVNSRLGVRHLEKLYVFLSRREEFYLLVVKSQQQRIIGVCSFLVPNTKVSRVLLCRFAFSYLRLLFTLTTAELGESIKYQRRLSKSLKGIQSVHITTFFVDPDFRQKGVGRLLITSVERWVASHGFQLLTVDVDKAAVNAIAAYKGMSFEAIHTDEDFTVFGKSIECAPDSKLS